MLRCSYHYESDFPSNSQSLVRHMIASHNNWVKTGVNELKNDVLAVFTFRDDVIYEKIDVAREPHLSDIYKLGRGVSRVEWMLKPPYPVDLKHRASFVLCGDEATIGVFYFGKVVDDPVIMAKKEALVISSFHDALLEVWKEEDIKRDLEKNAADIYVRDDILIRGKKCAGLDWMQSGDRFDFSLGIQNRYGPKEKKNIGTLLFNDPHWASSHGAKVGIAAAKIKVDSFIRHLQIKADEIYG